MTLKALQSALCRVRIEVPTLMVPFSKTTWLLVLPEGPATLRVGATDVTLGAKRRWQLIGVAGGAGMPGMARRRTGVPILRPARGSVTIHPGGNVIEAAIPLETKPESGSIGLTYLALGDGPNLVSGYGPILPDRGCRDVLTLRAEGSVEDQVASLARMVEWNGRRLDTDELRRLLSVGEPAPPRRRAFSYPCRPQGSRR